MKTILLLSPILFALLYAVFCEAHIAYCIDGKCSREKDMPDITLGESGKKTVVILKSTQDSGGYDSNFSIKSKSPNTKILFSVRKIDFKTNDCYKNNIKILPSYSSKPIAKFCQSQYDPNESASYLSEESELDFHFNIHDGDSADFEIIITVYSDVSTPNFDHRCNNNKYISSSLICDGHNNCGDRSDEMNCGGQRSIGLTSGISPIVIGCLLLIAIVA